ncbi:hypothetical protein ACHAXM_005966 [Skeletonema potamos]|jgi:hypothetical protein
MIDRRFFAIVGSLLIIVQSSAFSGGKSSSEPILKDCSSQASPIDGRRDFLKTTATSFAVILFTNNHPADAAPDCFTDCLKNCKLIAPKDPEYCVSSCQDYCSQTDRKDGLSGSVSSENGETGILGTTTVVKGEDKPPQIKIPGLDFTNEKGKKLLGY